MLDNKESEHDGSDKKEEEKESSDSPVEIVLPPLPIEPLQIEISLVPIIKSGVTPGCKNYMRETVPSCLLPKD